MAITIVFLTIQILFVLFTRRYERDFLKKQKKKCGIPVGLLGTGLFITDLIYKYTKQNITKSRQEEAFNIGSDEKRFSGAKIKAETLLVVFIGTVLTGGMLYINSHKNVISEIERPVFGKSKKIEAEVYLGDENRTLLLLVSGKDPDAESIQKVFENTFFEMQDIWKGDNDSLLEVRKSLNLQREAENGINFEFISLNGEVISNYGNIVTEEIPENGILCVYEVYACYKEFRTRFELEVTVLPEKKTEESEWERLESYLEEADENSLRSEHLEIPTEFENKTLKLYETGKPFTVVILMTAVLCFAINSLPGQRLKEKYKKRSEALIREYPGVLSKLSTLIEAGMSTRGAWMKMTADYQKRRKTKGVKLMYAYEEMLITSYKMQSGVPETECYLEFGRRCNLRQYVKLGNMLSQNIRQGISGLSREMADEMARALEERKNIALKKGEETGTKLLFPMLIMLGVVIISLVVPAFMSF